MTENAQNGMIITRFLYSCSSAAMQVKIKTNKSLNISEFSIQAKNLKFSNNKVHRKRVIDKPQNVIND